MDNSPSIRSCSRARTSERGFALAMALIIATLYFGLIGLMLFDASRELAEARRFRARIVALTLAENGAEHAAHMMVPDNPPLVKAVTVDDWQGSSAGTRMTNGTDFLIVGTGTTSGVVEIHAKVEINGKVDGDQVHIYYTRHSQ